MFLTLHMLQGQLHGKEQQLALEGRFGNLIVIFTFGQSAKAPGQGGPMNLLEGPAIVCLKQHT